MRFSLRVKFLAIIAIVLTTIFLAVTFTLVQYFSSTQRANLEREADAFAQLATDPIGSSYNIYSDSGRYRIRQEVDSFTALNPNVVNVAISDVEGNIVFSQHDDFEVGVTQEQGRSFEQSKLDVPEESRVDIIQPYLENFGQHRYSIVYSISTESVEQVVQQVVMRIIFVAVGVLVMTAVGFYILMTRYFLKPLKAVGHAAASITAGNLEQKIALESHDELADLAEDVNAMAEFLKADIAKLSEADKLKSEFLIIASHNLRTPLTVIQGNAELLESTELPEQAKKLLTGLKERSHELSTLAEDMLTIAQLEGGEAVDKDAPVIELAEFLKQKLPQLATQAQAKKIEFVESVPQLKVPVRINERYLDQIIGNVVDNAIKFTPENGKVSVSLVPQSQTAVIKVADTGIGIAPNELSKLFTKFHRGTSVMEYNYEGTGLGLYLTKLLLERHGGKIEVQSVVGQGSTFTLYLPLQAQQT